MSNIKDISSGATLDREKALEELFSNMPTEASVIIELPSRGRLYKGYSGVKVDPIKFEDEYRILSSKDNGINPINLIIENCVKGVNVRDLVAPDKLYLLLKIREVSYGKNYSFEILCPKCSGNVKASIDFSTLPVKYLEEDIQDIRKVKLPKLGVDAEVRFPRVADEIYTRSIEDLHNNLFRFVTSLNGISDPVFISMALKKMHIMDIKTIIKYINDLNFGVDATMELKCPHCKNSSIVEVPLSTNFFSVS